MGGRSRVQKLSDRWSWIEELSDSRLENYGRMSAHKIDQGESDLGKESLNFELARHFENKHGFAPKWKR